MVNSQTNGTKPLSQAEVNRRNSLRWQGVFLKAKVDVVDKEMREIQKILHTMFGDQTDLPAEGASLVFKEPKARRKPRSVAAIKKARVTRKHNTKDKNESVASLRRRLKQLEKMVPKTDGQNGHGDHAAREAVPVGGGQKA